MYYGATDEERSEAEALWEDAKQDSTRIEFSSAVPKKFRTFLRSEADATTVCTLQPCAIPGLLQTAGYFTAIRTAAHRFSDPSVGVEKAVASRLARQRLLYGDTALRLHALIDEGVLRRVAGDPAVMAEQLRHLVTMSARDNITIQVIRYDTGVYGSMSGAVTILGFDDPQDPDAVYLEYPAGGQWVDDRDDVRKFVMSFEDVRAQAASAKESAVLIEALADELEER